MFLAQCIHAASVCVLLYLALENGNSADGFQGGEKVNVKYKGGNESWAGTKRLFMIVWIWICTVRTGEYNHQRAKNKNSNDSLLIQIAKKVYYVSASPLNWDGLNKDSGWKSEVTFLVTLKIPQTKQNTVTVPLTIVTCWWVVFFFFYSGVEQLLGVGTCHRLKHFRIGKWGKFHYPDVRIIGVIPAINYPHHWPRLGGSTVSGTEAAPSDKQPEQWIYMCEELLKSQRHRVRGRLLSKQSTRAELKWKYTNWMVLEGQLNSQILIDLTWGQAASLCAGQKIRSNWKFIQLKRENLQTSAV